MPGRRAATKIAKRNLIWSIVAEHVGFSVWSIWSVMVLFMPQNVYGIDAAGKFYLVAVPTLIGAFMRIPYTVAPAKFGGRNWTIVSALLLLIPTVLTLWAMTTPARPTRRSWWWRRSRGSAEATSPRR